MSDNRTAVVALGGNAISVPGEEDTIAKQFANTRESLSGIVELARQGYRLVVTHGNGPQVGNMLLRIELARGKAPILPLGVLVADSEGGMGYMIEQCLHNRLTLENIDRKIVTIVTQMLVDEHDPAFDDPTKFVGQFYSQDKAMRYSAERGWKMKADGERGWRRVVASPTPVRTIAADTIRGLVDKGVIVIAGGGGGIPVYETKDGMLEGLDAVIDKDFASALLASEIQADSLAILTGVDRVALNFGSDNEEQLGDCTLSQIKRYQGEGHFPAGSMGPKIRAAIKFLEEGGKKVVITSFKNAALAMAGQAGTRILPD